MVARASSSRSRRTSTTARMRRQLRSSGARSRHSLQHVLGLLVAPGGVQGLAVDVGVVLRRERVQPKGALGIGHRLFVGAEAHLRLGQRLQGIGIVRVDLDGALGGAHRALVVARLGQRKAQRLIAHGEIGLQSDRLADVLEPGLQILLGRPPGQAEGVVLDVGQTEIRVGRGIVRVEGESAGEEVARLEQGLGASWAPYWCWRPLSTRS